jgi:asparagine synthase (glutamine-hydrolysing)
MCGILAVLNFDNEIVDKELIIRMRDTMYHRGPDDAGLYIQESVALAHRRLAIIDLSETGHQPMANEDGSLFVACNGEIYNYVELKEDLKKRGHRFSSTSDSEVILHQYEEDGKQCLNKFNGMFSFVLWDNKEKRLFAARDRLGIKPLYYYVDNKKVIFSSEIKAILENPYVLRKPDYQAIADFFFAGRALGNKTMFQEIKEVEPGYMAEVDKAKMRVRVEKYWDVLYNYNYSWTDEDLKEQLFSLLDDSVKINCRSDAPLGCHLSGGLDSSTVVAFAARYRESLKTFSIKFSEDPYIDETKYAKAVANHVGAHYIESSPTALDMVQVLPFLIWHMDIPLATSGGFAYFTVSNLAKKYVKVSLTGHGGDELFAGYPAQYLASYKNADGFELHRDPDRDVKFSLGKAFIRSLVRKGPRGIYESIRNRLFKEEKSFEDLWVQLHCGTEPKHNPVFHQDFVAALQRYSPKDDYIKPLIEISTDQVLDKCLYHDLRVYLPGLLHWEDRASMSVSLESRVPLLDHRIVEFLATIPPEKKVDGMESKHLLREIGSSLLPEEVWKRRDKRPFPVPGKFSLSKEMNEMTQNILLSPESLKRGIFDPRVLKDHSNNNSNISSLWQLINVELWFKIFIDKNPQYTHKIDL